MDQFIGAAHSPAASGVVICRGGSIMSRPYKYCTYKRLQPPSSSSSLGRSLAPRLHLLAPSLPPTPRRPPCLHCAGAEPRLRQRMGAGWWPAVDPATAGLDSVPTPTRRAEARRVLVLFSFTLTPAVFVLLMFKLALCHNYYLFT